MTKRKLLISISGVLILIFLSIVLAVAFLKMKKTPEKKPPEIIKRYVKTVPVKYQTFNSEFKASGRVASQNKIDLSTEVRGKILPGQVSLKKGQSFRKGQLLFKIYDQEAKLALQAHKSRFLNALANILPDFKIDFKDSYQSWNTFFNSIDIRKDIPELPKINSNKEKIYLAGRNILSDWYSIKSEEIILRKYYIHAPFNGAFTNVYAEIGAIASPGVRIAQLIRTDKNELEVPVEAVNIRFLKTGQKVKILSGDKNETFTGTILRISDFVDPNTQSVPVFIDISARKNIPVYQGEYMEAVFSNIKLENVFEITREAVFNQNHVFIVENGKLRKKSVNIVKINEITMFINGLPENSIIVNEALINAEENMNVEIL